MRNGRVSRDKSIIFALLISLGLPRAAAAQTIHTYVGRIAAESFLLAWGTTDGGGNSIGRESRPLGIAELEVAGRKLEVRRNWIEVAGLSPDTEYPYRLRVNGRPAGEGTVRTHPRAAERLAFFVIGDYGNGSANQLEIAEVMWREWERRARSDNPVRFVLTTGDNIYSTRRLGFLPTSTGLYDRDWRRKFFEPYQPILKSIPFYPTLGNHDLKSAYQQDRGEVGTYLDNFFFPSPEPARYYTYSVGGFADFFALDSTTLSSSEARSDLGPRGRQYQWLARALAASKSPWKIAYFHHPPFSAGPEHPGSHPYMKALMNLFSTSGVQTVFSGHEHNFQVSERNQASGGVLYVVSGAGGQLRSGGIQDDMKKANIAAIASQRHFLLVELEGRTMKITPLSTGPVIVRDHQGKLVTLPLTLQESF